MVTVTRYGRTRTITVHEAWSSSGITWLATTPPS
jgi:hypothetical protein